jgi:hypothetical protein
MLPRFGLDPAVVDGLIDRACAFEPLLPAKTCLGEIILYVQWANLGGKGQEYDPAFFNKIKDAFGDTFTLRQVDDDKPTPMSELTKAWIYLAKREYNTPYIKRTYGSKSTTLIRTAGPTSLQTALGRSRTTCITGEKHSEAQQPRSTLKEDFQGLFSLLFCSLPRRRPFPLGSAKVLWLISSN